MPQWSWVPSDSVQFHLTCWIPSYTFRCPLPSPGTLSMMGWTMRTSITLWWTIWKLSGSRRIGRSFFVGGTSTLSNIMNSFTLLVLTGIPTQAGVQSRSTPYKYARSNLGRRRWHGSPSDILLLRRTYSSTRQGMHVFRYYHGCFEASWACLIYSNVSLLSHVYTCTISIRKLYFVHHLLRVLNQKTALNNHQ